MGAIPAGPRTPSQARMELAIALSAGVPVRVAHEPPRVGGDAGGSARDRPGAGGRGPRGVVRRRRAARHDPRRPHSDFDLATSARPEEVRKLFRRTAPIGVEHGTVGVHRPEAGDARGHHLPPRRRHRRPARGRRVRRVARRRSRPPRLHHQRHRVPSAPPRVARSVRRRARSRGRGWCAPSAIPRRGSGRTISGSCARSASPRGSASRSSPRPGDAAREAAGGLGRLSAERVREEWFKGLRTAQEAGDAGASCGSSPGRRRSGCRSCSPSVAAPRRDACRRRRGIRCCSPRSSRPTPRACCGGCTAPTRKSRGPRRSRTAQRSRRAGTRSSVRRWLVDGRWRGGRPDRHASAPSRRAAIRPGSPAVRAIREPGRSAHPRRARGDRAGPARRSASAARGSARRWRCCSTGCWRIPRPTPASACSTLAREQR